MQDIFTWRNMQHIACKQLEPVEQGVGVVAQIRGKRCLNLDWLMDVQRLHATA